MHAVDTNVVVRYLVSDHDEQATKARKIITGTEVFISRTVLLEVEWVLRHFYKVPPSLVHRSFRSMAGLKGVQLENPDQIAQALEWAEAGMDFADALHLAAAAECQAFLTFDSALIRRAKTRSPIPVKAP